ncbi:MAG: hypothetical protein WBQ34_12055 [Candidatus Acidiferrales bacterium]
MRNRRRTIESLRRLAERPGTKAEGETAQKLLDQMLGNGPRPKPFDASKFPPGTRIFYNRWAYEFNQPGTVRTRGPKIIQGETWLLIKFDRLKNATWVPVTSRKGCHISTHPLPDAECDYLYHEWRDD